MACGGGGGGGNGNNIVVPPSPPPCEDKGISATAIYRPEQSTCNTENTLSVRVSNQSCDPLTFDSISTHSVDPSNPCGELGMLDNFPINPVTIESKEAETVDLLTFSWCCSCNVSFECTWQRDLTLHTDQGDIQATPTKLFTKKFGPFCQPCSSGASGLLAPIGSAGPECRVGIDVTPAPPQ